MLIRLPNTLLRAAARTGGSAFARVWDKRIVDWLTPVRQLIPIQWRNGYGRACLLSLLLMPALVHAVPAGTVISNTAQADYSLGVTPKTATSNLVSTTTVALRTNAVVELLQYSAAAGSTETLSITEYSTSGLPAGPFAPLAAPTPFGSATPINLAAPVPVVPATIYHQGEPIIMRLTDADQNLDPSLAETILVRLTTANTGDSEILRFTETGPNTGVFTGYIASQGGSTATTNDGIITLDLDDTLSVTYTDIADGSDIAVDSTLVDPFGIVFDSVTGLPVDGASVTLIDVSTGLPAQIFGDDGVSIFPATVVTGGSVTDSGGTVYNFPAGSFRFPFVAPGTYRFDVTPPAAYSMPSVVATTDLQLLPGAPFAMTTGSRGEDFVVNPGPALNIDIPVDPGITGLFVQKSTPTSRVSIGDLLPYSISVQNTTIAIINGVFIDDRLPLGFRYRSGSLRIDGLSVADPSISADGRNLQILLGDIASTAIVNVTYVAEVGVGTPTGDAVNQVVAQDAGGLVSNPAQARVEVEELFMRDHNILFGRVTVGECDAEATEIEGAAGVRIYMEDGRYVVTDEKGRFHFEGVHPGSHVVQLDEDSLPEIYEPIICNEYSQFSGRAYSRFVDLQGGTLWRTDFHLALKPVQTGDVSLQLKAELDDRRIHYTLELNGGEIGLSTRNLSVVMPDNVSYVQNTSTIDGAPLAEPEINANVLTYRLGSSNSAWSARIEFEAKVESQILPAELLSKAILGFSSVAGTNGRTPLAEARLLTPPKAIKSETMLRTRFGSFKVHLNGPQQQIELEKIVAELRDENNLHIFVVGHADSQNISAIGRRTYADNYALSEARAITIGKFLTERLNLTPSQITILGIGTTEPAASNDTDEGRGQNRRVEIEVVSEVPVPTAVKPVAESVLQTTQALGSRPGEILQQADNAVPKSVTSNAMPLFDKAWLAQVETGQDWLWPAADHYPSIPSTKIAIKHGVSEKPTLLLDGKEVSALNFDGAGKNTERNVAVSHWFGVDLEIGENHFEVIFHDADGNETGRLQHMVYVANPPVNAELVPEQSRLIADGSAPSVIAIRLTDQQGYPARQGVVGEFSVAAPYAVFGEREDARKLLLENAYRPVKYRVGEDGVALIELEPTTRSGEVVVSFPFENDTGEVRAWLEADTRDWIVVGIAEGTVGYGSISGNMEALAASDAEDELYTDGRIALFAKGRIKGEWLLTLAYDSEGKQQHDRQRLHQTIDPDEYYTLYGDTTEQGYEAASSKKLYLKIERKQFYAMFGDYTTGLTVSELSRYDRSLTGIKSKLQRERYGYNVFASETENSFARDEIRGDGTSGLYRLSRGDIVINSEKITIETRDRFRSEVIISSQHLTRHLDYSIDYGDGSLFFKSPVSSRDANFNPIYIVVNYETNQASGELLSFGGRGYLRPADGIEVGATYISEQQVAGDARMSGIDATIELGKGTQLKAEVSRSHDAAGNDADAYLAELQHRSGRLDAKVYLRQQEDGFGLGQQRGSENATRKMGFDGSYQLNDHTQLNSEAYRQENLATGANREVLEAGADFDYGRYRFDIGARTARDNFTNGDSYRSDHLTLGAGARLLDNRLDLHISRDQSLNNDANTDYPTRTLLGADYRLTRSLSLFAEHEFTDGDNIKTQNTRVGLSATPWTGATVNTSLGQELDENGDRVYANVGLNQRWVLNQRWSVDANIEGSETMKDTAPSLNLNVPPASGSGGDDFTAVSAGVNYRRDSWNWNARVEQRNSDTEDKNGFYTGFAGDLSEGLGMSFRLQYFDSDKLTGEQHRQSDLRFSLAYRPLHSRWTVLNRTDFISDRQLGGSVEIDNSKWINNTNANYKNDGTQLSLQYGAKYAKGMFEDSGYSGYTDLIGAEYRRDLGQRWDVGAHASILNSRELDQLQYSYGLSVGLNVAPNMWASLGYNWDGFRDDDFTASDYTAEGVYLKFRLKFDQHSVREAAEWFTSQ